MLSKSSELDKVVLKNCVCPQYSTIPEMGPGNYDLAFKGHIENSFPRKPTQFLRDLYLLNTF